MLSDWLHLSSFLPAFFHLKLCARGLAKRIEPIELRLELVVRILPAKLQGGRHRAVVDGERIKGDVNPLDAFEPGDEKSQ